MLESAPQFDTATVAELLHRHFALDGEVRALCSERDQNFMIEAAGRRAVFKIANAGESRALIEAQLEVMQRLAAAGVPVPRVLSAADGARIVSVPGPDGATHAAWAVTALPGVPLAQFTLPPQSLMSELGHTIGVMSRALDGFDHPAAHRELKWDLASGRAVAEERRALVTDPSAREGIARLLASFDRCTAPCLPRLRRAVIHGDLNDHNILVERGGPGDPPRLGGIIDLGDMVHSYAVADLAIACAYAILDAPEPLSAMRALVEGCHAVRPLDEAELGALFGLVALRVCVSACVAAEQVPAHPDNPYLDVSQARVRQALPRLAATSFEVAEAVLRDACGRPPVAAAPAVREWLVARRGTFAPVLGTDLTRTPTVVLDLSVGSSLVNADPAGRDEAHLTPVVARAMEEAGARLAIGRYDEPRVLYLTPQFGGEGAVTDERRTVHIGLDLFAAGGTPVFAPLSGTVHACTDNAVPLDYGPTIILRHETDAGVEFFTLYGHLSRESLGGLRRGQRVERGARIGWLGAPTENGGWTPHLHLQVMASMLGYKDNFPGVAPASQRRAWCALCPDPNLLAGVPAGRFPPPSPPAEVTLATRQRLFGGNLSVSYRQPLKAIRGWKQYVFDETGRQFVDGFNNVPHVGHAHPRVVAAAAAQMGVLNANTRYLHDLPAQYAERLGATLPDPLRVCYFTNSASEANELALRMARAATGGRDLIVLEAAYHGNTTTLIDISPYKHAGPGGAGAPDWVHVAPLPDDYRGQFRRGDPEVGARYAAAVAALAQSVRDGGRRLSGFIAETCPSVGGQLMLPQGYLAAAYDAVRRAGGVCIADEVQTGLGRIGTHVWAFQAHGVVPDIVVMGKPIGNGHPLAAVVTTRAIANAFDNGMEYFSTFGGNTVSCAVGLAVLDVLRDERLQEHARSVGARMLADLRALADRHAVIGDVRGSGFFLGVDLVRDRTTRQPAAAEAAYVANRMRERGVLIGTDGPYHNVLKIRPPMPFNGTDAGLLVEVLDQVLGEVGAGRG
ncbi:MAG TPA: aminotransferase class III-fold pyridoxal phosphate-dependent enzyme [Gemmatimonadaceae bacterium]|nr:aminotransferase class III-fold pyridoxal phosphate-dependent enzyme [Gemmatimonadaceae bacterium]